RGDPRIRAPLAGPHPGLQHGVERAVQPVRLPGARGVLRLPLPAAGQGLALGGPDRAGVVTSGADGHGPRRPLAHTATLASRISRTFRARPSGLNGFSMKATSGSSTPRCAIVSPV